MKKTFLYLLSFLVIGAGAVQAQDVKAVKKVLKSSSKALKNYKTDPSNTAKLDEAMSNLEKAMEMEDAQKMPEVWLAKANIYQTQAEMDILARNDLMKADLLAGTETAAGYVIKHVEAPVKAYHAFKKALELTEKKSSKAKIVKEMEKNATFLNDIATLLYANNKDYENSYKSFNTLVEASKIVADNGGKPLLETPESIEEIRFYAAYTAELAGKKDEALVIYEQMYANGSKKIDVYNALFEAYKENDEAKALKILEEGRAIDPENVNLLFSEINFYLQKGDYTTLEGKLKEAMEKEPNNASLRAVMGNVYNDFYKNEEDPAKAEEHFKKAENFYKKALEINDESFEALYSLGELNYNKAATLVAQYNELPITASQREVEELKSKYLAAFDVALPYFLKADEINPKDYNTLLALKEIYAKKDDYTKSKEYKDRLESL